MESQIATINTEVEFMFQLFDSEMKELIANCNRFKSFNRTMARKAA